VTGEALERAEQAALRDMIAAAPAEVRAALGLAHAEIAGAGCIAVATARDMTMLNRVTGLGLAGAVGDGALDAIDAFYAGHGTRYAVALTPTPHADDLRERLIERGFTDDYAWMKFSRPPLPPPTPHRTPSDLRVERVGSEAAGEFGHITAMVYGMPDAYAAWLGALTRSSAWACFMARDEMGRACATGALHLDDHGAWLGIGACLESHRRRGAQTLLLRARIEAAAEAGATLIVTETGARGDGVPDSSYRNLLSACFAERYARANLESPAQKPFWATLLA
jgi:hypothetical protein